MLKDFIIIKHITIFILPYIFLYGLYIQINGAVSPGGGFQAGVILASTIIGFDLIYDKFIWEQYFSTNLLIFMATVGVMVYATIGVVSFLFDDNYLNYYSLATNKLFAQHIGIFIIELGVGLTVTSIMCLIYSIITHGVKI